MTLEELLAVAEIVEKLTNRYRDQDAAHKTALAELRASCNARTASDEHRLENLREEIIRLNDANGRLLVERDTLREEVATLKSPTPKHPVKVGEWVRRTDDECGGIYFGRGVIAQVLAIFDAPEQQYTVSRPEWNGYTVPWAMQYCEPCDPPEATHDTEAGKAAAESALKTEPVAEEIKVGDLGEVFQATTRTLNSDVGITGRVSSVHLDPCHGGFLVTFDPSTQSRRSAGMQAFGLCDVRKVTT